MLTEDVQHIVSHYLSGNMSVKDRKEFEHKLLITKELQEELRFQLAEKKMLTDKQEVWDTDTKKKFIRPKDLAFLTRRNIGKIIITLAIGFFIGLFIKDFLFAPSSVIKTQTHLLNNGGIKDKQTKDNLLNLPRTLPTLIDSFLILNNILTQENQKLKAEISKMEKQQQVNHSLLSPIYLQKYQSSKTKWEDQKRELDQLIQGNLFIYKELKKQVQVLNKCAEARQEDNFAGGIDFKYSPSKDSILYSELQKEVFAGLPQNDNTCIEICRKTEKWMQKWAIEIVEIKGRKERLSLIANKIRILLRKCP